MTKEERIAMATGFMLGLTVLSGKAGEDAALSEVSFYIDAMTLTETERNAAADMVETMLETEPWRSRIA